MKQNKKQKVEQGDRTTRRRFEVIFDKEHYLREAYYENCDYTRRVTPELLHRVEQQVQKWLDNKGVEAQMLEITLTGAAEKDSLNLTFTRCEVALKTCLNNWNIIHLAHSSFWPRILSSKPKLTIQHSGGEYLRMNNEIRPINYGVEEREQAEFAAHLLKSPVSLASSKLENLRNKKHPGFKKEVKCQK
jgi:hypothetical protein